MILIPSIHSFLLQPQVLLKYNLIMAQSEVFGSLVAGGAEPPKAAHYSGIGSTHKDSMVS